MNDIDWRAEYHRLLTETFRQHRVPAGEWWVGETLDLTGMSFIDGNEAILRAAGDFPTGAESVIEAGDAPDIRFEGIRVEGNLVESGANRGIWSTVSDPETPR